MKRKDQTLLIGRELVIQLPATNPKDDPTTLWALQLELLELTESLLGPRDATKKIYQPTFTTDGPHVRHNPNRDGVFVELSLNGEQYWPTVVYEMAHETVHLLNPVLLEEANNLEEGVAVAVSVMVQPSYGIEKVQSPSFPPYVFALQLVGMLPGHPLASARLIRERIGAFSVVTAEDLGELFPQVDQKVLQELAARFSGGGSPQATG